MNSAILTLTLLSALFLGVYDLLKKVSLGNNSSFFVLWIANIAGFLFALPFALVMGQVHLSDFSSQIQGYIFLKAVLVNTSWNLAYIGLKNLPLSIASPLRASAPLWVCIGGVVLFGEHLNLFQWLGIVVIGISYLGFSQAGKREGIHFLKSWGVLAVMGATFLGATSALYDKYLLSSLHIPALKLQVWFSFYLVLIQSLLWLWISKKEKSPQKFSWTMPFIGIVLVLSDILYFFAVQSEGSYISVISPLRRTGVVVSFSLAFLFLKEKNFQKKWVPLLGLVLGVIIIGLWGR